MKLNIGILTDYLPDLDGVVDSDNGVSLLYEVGTDPTNFGQIVRLSIQDSLTGNPVIVDFQTYHKVANYVRQQGIGQAMHLDSLMGEAKW